MVKITYISHSCFAVELEHSVLVFDYYQGELPLWNPEKTIYVFVSHRHYDHFSKEFLNEDDHVLIIDDFLANGCAMLGLIDLVKGSGATIEGAGVVIEKGMQNGGDLIRSQGVHLESLAIIDSMTDTSLTFRN